MTVTFRVNVPKYTPAGARIFLAGSFNNWNPGDQRYAFTPGNSPVPGKETDQSAFGSLALSLLPGNYEYKVTRGTWESGETAPGGGSAGNRSVAVLRDTIIDVTVADWADRFPKAPKTSTAHERVSRFEIAMDPTQPATKRRVWVYLPAGYASSKRKYPVLYMHDGQNVFDDSSSFSGEWGVDEALDTLEKTFGAVIVVAIDNGGPKRMNEYSPYDMQRFGKGEGDRYVDFLVNNLRPYINKNFRGSKKRKDTYIAGSSMGGLISLYALLKYPKVFGGAGVFSPAFWIAPGIQDAVNEKGRKVKGRIYFMAGLQESETMVPDMLAVFNTMHKLSKAPMEAVIRSNGKHNEATWRAEFPLFYKWLRN